MRSRISVGAISTALIVGSACADTQERLNPMIGLHEQGQPLFGMYAPANRRARTGTPATVQKTPVELAQETLGFNGSDYVFNGSMEGSVERALPAWTSYVEALREAGSTIRTNPLVVKTPGIAEDLELATRNIGLQLNTGVSGVMFVGVESADEVRHGLAAMRLRANGGSRSDDVGYAPEYWGISEAEYRRRADLWPLNPDGELINWTIVESLEGLANVREIAAVEGIGVLWPGAGTLRGLFSPQDASGRRVLDEDAWEASIQKVLDACKEFDIACGFPANETDIEMRIEQGFSVFVMNWGEAGFRTIDVGRSAAGR
jgi:4-hydroxy-2-oxoheptanedioate aldolase